MVVVVMWWGVLEGLGGRHEENWRRQGEHLLNRPDLMGRIRFSLYLRGGEEGRGRMFLMGFDSGEELTEYNRRLSEDYEFKRLHEEWRNLINPSTRRVEVWEACMEDLWIK
ncbi:hypothetical protein J7L60_04920 [Candidatus Bathyarchaeota archaeon]|nr:hypothetical protein [Candidatus Bathyarchaeota archaeon]